MVAIDAGVGTNLWRRAKCDDRMKIRNRAGTAARSTAAAAARLQSHSTRERPSTSACIYAVCVVRERLWVVTLETLRSEGIVCAAGNTAMLKPA